MPRTSALLIATVLVVSGLPATSLAERAWVKDEVRLNIRTGPGVEYRIRGAVKTGDSFEVLSRTEGWTEVRGRDALQGWIPAGYLQAEAPARIRLERHEADTAELRLGHSRLSEEVQTLRTENTELSETRTTLQSRLDTLEKDNMELRAGARWPEWITGASILIVGGVLGMIVHAATTRRQTRRIRI
ncbi:MAG: TIGR04211 family SH3 domain-containing protein [Myxococcota bacterium]|nr:TIGR04211 family SH3 domain-containing protein [Myxococcota bacterium]